MDLMSRIKPQEFRAFEYPRIPTPDPSPLLSFHIMDAEAYRLFTTALAPFITKIRGEPATEEKPPTEEEFYKAFPLMLAFVIEFHKWHDEYTV